MASHLNFERQCLTIKFKTMKNLKYVSFVLMLFIGVGSIQAQQKELVKKDKVAKNQNFKKTDRKKKMQKELNMTPEQIKKIEDIRAKRADEKVKLRKEMKELNEAERNEIQAVYTPEQKEKMKELRQTRKESMKEHRGKKKMQHKKMRNKKRR